MTEFSELQGKTITQVQRYEDERIVFVCDDGKSYRLYHAQDCCESVVIESITGDLTDLIGTPILLAEEASNNDHDDPNPKSCDTNTWTFYKLRTIKGSVDIRWHGSSNGYYSERVDFVEVR